MLANGDIYLGTYSGWYSVRDEAFYDESETQVTEGGTRLGPQGTPVEWTQEKTYFFRLSAYQDRLLRYYEEHPEFIGPETRRNEVLSFVRGGLQDLSISRSTLSWGVPVPDAPGHVMYVWVDALTSYITAVEFPDEKAANWRYWPADFHIIGKDIVRFHAVYWPAFLMSAGVAVPKRIFGHGFLFNRGEKMSKSVGNVIDPLELADAYGVDQLRYFFLREVAFGQDGSYSHEAIVGRINADLANDLGNLAQRSLSMIARDCKGLVPSAGALSDADVGLLAEVDALPARLRKSMGELALHVALSEIWNLVGATNRYFASEEPWAKRKSDPARFATILHVTLEALRAIAITTQPFIPGAAAKLLELLGVSPHLRSLQDVGARGRTEAGRVLPAPVPIFPRYVDPEAPAAGAAR
jgi:methionyl-tRNA synthetase